MKIVLVNNNVIHESDLGLFVYKETGKFFNDIKELGHRVIVFQYSMKMKESDFLSNYNIEDKGFTLKIVKRGKISFFAFVKAFFKGIRVVLKADFIYLFYPGNLCIYLALLALLFGKGYGFYVRGENKIMSPISRFLYKRAKVVFTISPRFTEMIKDFGANSKTIRPMMVFGDKDIIHNRQYKSKTKYKLLFVGRIERDKGVFEIIEAISILHNQNIDNFEMHFVGDGIDLVKMKSEIQEAGLCDLVFFHGTIVDKQKLREFYIKSDLFILPSHHEGFPRVLYEAMIHGIPILSTFVGTISYLLKDKVNCNKLEVRDSTLIVKYVKAFLTNYEENGIIAKNGTKTIIDYLSDKKDEHSLQLHKEIK
tara:strand:+ start:9 stop:1106 length:1098 start_codon:yes stop_codon:yes gene_type:complete